MPIGGQSSHILKEFQLHRFLLTSQQVTDAVKQYQGLPTEVSQWAASSYQWHLWSLHKIMITILHQFYIYLLYYYTVTCFSIKALFSRQTFTFYMKTKGTWITEWESELWPYGLCWKRRTKATDGFVLLQDVMLSVENTFPTWIRNKTTQHNLTAPTEDVFELTTHSWMTQDLSDLVTDIRQIQCT